MNLNARIRLQLLRLAAVVGILLVQPQGRGQSRSHDVTNIPSYPNFYAQVFRGVQRGFYMRRKGDPPVYELDLEEKHDFDRYFRRNTSGAVYILNFPLPPDLDSFVRENYVILPLAAEPMRFVVGDTVGAAITLDVTALEKIYAGKIRFWDDPAIAQTNPGRTFPHQAVLPFISYSATTLSRPLPLSIGDSASTFALFQVLWALDSQWKGDARTQTDQIYRTAGTDVMLSSVRYPAIQHKGSLSLAPEHIYRQVYLPWRLPPVGLTTRSVALPQLTDASVMAAIRADDPELRKNQIHYAIRFNDRKCYPILTYHYALIPRVKPNRAAMKQLSTLVDTMFAHRQDLARQLGYTLLTPELRLWVSSRIKHLQSN